jgi:hypothetical protein
MHAAGMIPDEWQLRLMTSHTTRALLNTSRQSGKSTVVAAISLEQALTQPGSTTLLVSASQRQSAELLAKVRAFAMQQAEPINLEQLSVLSMRLANGSRIVSLPGRAEVIRGYTADLLVLDEASWITDSLYESVRPMLAVSGGRLIALSTPFGRRGWFYNAWTSPEKWTRVRVTAYECPRISEEFLAEERRSLPANVFAAEYLCEFSDTLDAVFSSEDVTGALDDSVAPLFGPTPSTPADDNVVPLFA